MGHITLTMPLLGKLCIDRLGLLVVNVYTKFEVSHFICYEDKMAMQNVENGVVRGHSRSLSPFVTVRMTSYSTLIETMCLCRATYDI